MLTLCWCVSLKEISRKDKILEFRPVTYLKVVLVPFCHGVIGPFSDVCLTCQTRQSIFDTVLPFACSFCLVMKVFETDALSHLYY